MEPILVSLDVGYKNFAAAAFDPQNKKIFYWNRISLNISSFNAPEVVEKLVSNGLAPILESPLVIARGCRFLIEKQIPSPRIHKILMVDVALHAYLVPNNE